MYNGVKEEKQKMLDKMCEAIMEMEANGSENNNHIIGLRLFHRDEWESTWCGDFQPGDYVRIIWSEDPKRKDGYYDVYVDCDSCFGMFEDVWKQVKKSIG